MTTEINKAVVTRFNKEVIEGRNASLMDELLLLGFAGPDSNAYAVLRERFDAATAYWSSHRLAARTHPAFVL